MPKIMKTLTKMSRMEFVNFMCGQTHKHFAALTAETIIDAAQMKGGKVTAAKYGGFVKKVARITWHESVDYQRVVETKLKKFDLDPTAFLAEEHKFAKRELCGGKLTSMAYHKADELLPIDARRWYLVVYVMDGIVKSTYNYTNAFGAPVLPAVIHADLYDKRSKKQADAGLVNIADQVIYRNYSINSLHQVSVEGMQIALY